MIVEELDSFLSSDMSLDYWYDQGFDFAKEMLYNLPITHWEKLRNILPHRNEDWKTRLAYAIDEDCGVEGFTTLLVLLESQEQALVETALDSLRSYLKIPQFQREIANNKLIERQLLLLEKTASKPVLRMLQEIKKLKSI